MTTLQNASVIVQNASQEEQNGIVEKQMFGIEAFNFFCILAQSILQSDCFCEMPAIKSRNWSLQEDELLTEIVQIYYQLHKYTWNEIADLMATRCHGFKKNGKQCRQRWTNQLNPQIKGNNEWSNEQNQILFSAHNQFGNKWAQISDLLVGRTDNCVKNHFYSTLRKGLRKINNYIETVKRKKQIVKVFKPQILNKILVLSEGKNDDKFQFNAHAKQLSIQIKNSLTTLALSTQDNESITALKENLFLAISDFCKNCRRKKAKKAERDNQDNYEQQIEAFMPVQENSEDIGALGNENGVNNKEGFEEDEKKKLFLGEEAKKPIRKMESLESNKSQLFMVKLEQDNGQSSFKTILRAQNQRLNFKFGNNQDFIVSNPHKTRPLGQQRWGHQSNGPTSSQKQDAISKLGFISGTNSSFSLFQPKASQTRTQGSENWYGDKSVSNMAKYQSQTPLFSLFLQNHVLPKGKLPQTSYLLNSMSDIPEQHN